MFIPQDAHKSSMGPGWDAIKSLPSRDTYIRRCVRRDLYHEVVLGGPQHDQQWEVAEGHYDFFTMKENEFVGETNVKNPGIMPVRESMLWDSIDLIFPDSDWEDIRPHVFDFSVAVIMERDEVNRFWVKERRRTGALNVIEGIKHPIGALRSYGLRLYFPTKFFKRRRRVRLMVNAMHDEPIS